MTGNPLNTCVPYFVDNEDLDKVVTDPVLARHLLDGRTVAAQFLAAKPGGGDPRVVFLLSPLPEPAPPAPAPRWARDILYAACFSLLVQTGILVLGVLHLLG